MARLNIGARPFVRWQGSKDQHLRILDQALPARFATLPSVTYIEPFVGGGAMMFHMLQTYRNITRIVINDNNLDLMRTYNTVRDRSAELIAELKSIQHDFLPLGEADRRAYFEAARAEMNEHLIDGLRHTALFIFLNRTSVGGQGLRYHHTRCPVICEEELLRADACVLQRVVIMCEDFEKTYNEACGNTFFFLDPPGPPVGRAKALGWDEGEQRRLKKFCDLLNFRHFDWMLTGSEGRGSEADEEQMYRLYGNYDIQRIWSQKVLASAPMRRTQGGELLVRNFQREIRSLHDLQYTQLSLAF